MADLKVHHKPPGTLGAVEMGRSLSGTKTPQVYSCFCSVSLRV